MSDPEGYRFLPHDQERCQCEGCQRHRAMVPVTGPVVPAGGEELREALTERLVPFVWSTGDSDAVIAEILPAIHRFAEAQGRRRAAEELRAAADEVGVPAYWRRRLDARAAALAPENARPE